jgi:hypothetical protein
MPVSVARQVEYYLEKYAPGRDIKVNALALTRDQVERYGLPRTPIKEKDNRKARFEDRRGEGAVELDALEALHQGELGRLVREAVAPYRDPTLAARLEEAGRDATALATAAWEDQTRETREQLAALHAEIASRAEKYRPTLQALNAMLEAELAPLRARLDELRHGLERSVAQLQVGLPDRPEADLEEPDEDDWLFDSNRDFLGQLEAYQQWKATKTLDDWKESCEVCRRKYVRRRKDQTTCSVGCRNQTWYQWRKDQRRSRISEPVACPVCGTMFVRKRASQLMSSNACNQKACRDRRKADGRNGSSPANAYAPEKISHFESQAEVSQEAAADHGLTSGLPADDPAAAGASSAAGDEVKNLTPPATGGPP